MPDPETDISPESAREAPDEGFVEDTPEDSYDPSEVEVTRGRMQGLGVGARDLNLQGDPDRDLASDITAPAGGRDDGGDDGEDDTDS